MTNSKGEDIESLNLNKIYDVAIIGAGPAGLNAALQASWLKISAALIDENIGHIKRLSRIRFADKMYNVPGFHKKSGLDLLRDMEQVLEEHIDCIDRFYETKAVSLVRVKGFYRLITKVVNTGLRREIRAKSVIVATGVEDLQPEIHNHPKLKPILPIFPYANSGLVYYCQVCDGSSTAGKNVGVLGHSSQTTGLAVNLIENFGARAISIITHGKKLLQDQDLSQIEKAKIFDKLKKMKIKVYESRIVDLYGLREKKFGVVLSDGSRIDFDKGFADFGWYRINKELVESFEPKSDVEGFLMTDGDKQLLNSEGEPVEGLYVVGDLTNDWKQVDIAWAHAKTAVLHLWKTYV
ncbi:MAG: NAD(P)/FAD-dependent oxidoreductase [Thaumarchaeota archaeon]|nr:NAD(P)/FAD-dependent oxidoreductase [Nitrososphaerota archaeon]